MNRLRTWSAALAMIGTLMAADEATAQHVIGAWELVQVGGKELPAVLEVEGDCREEVVTAVLTLNADSTWKLERTERDVCGNKTEEETETETGRYRLTGSNIEMLDADGDSQQDDAGDDLDDFSVGNVQGKMLNLRLGKAETQVAFRKR